MQVINKILNLEISNFFWLLIMRKISRFYKIYFIPTNKKNLPLNNHPVGDLKGSFEHQFSFYKNKKFNLNVYYLLKKNFKKNAKIRFLDYGGENLDLYLYLKDQFPRIEITIINQNKLNIELKRFIRNKKIKDIKVFKNIKNSKNLKYNFVHFGSSLQYLRNYEKILKFLLRKTVGFLCISASSFFYEDIKKRIITKQVNLLPIIMYCYIFNFNYLKKLIISQNFKILSKKANPYKKINFNNFDFKVDHLNLVFKKNI